jgi:hypothetical protein
MERFHASRSTQSGVAIGAPMVGERGTTTTCIASQAVVTGARRERSQCSRSATRPSASTVEWSRRGGRVGRVAAAAATGAYVWQSRSLRGLAPNVARSPQAPSSGGERCAERPSLASRRAWWALVKRSIAVPENGPPLEPHSPASRTDGTTPRHPHRRSRTTPPKLGASPAPSLACRWLCIRGQDAGSCAHDLTAASRQGSVTPETEIGCA